MSCNPNQKKIQLSVPSTQEKIWPTRKTTVQLYILLVETCWHAIYQNKTYFAQKKKKYLQIYAYQNAFDEHMNAELCFRIRNTQNYHMSWKIERKSKIKENWTIKLLPLLLRETEQKNCPHKTQTGAARVYTNLYNQRSRTRPTSVAYPDGTSAKAYLQFASSHCLLSCHFDIRPLPQTTRLHYMPATECNFKLLPHLSNPYQSTTSSAT